MTQIHILSKSVADRIAAGEVVERPASVVKELIENAIDAGATAIAVEIREGGTALIRVSDNGSGMTRADAELAVERFATSKISSERDLQTVRTLGFRGEALPSVAVVSQLEILTRARDEIEGTRVRVVDGEKQVEVAGAPMGTQVTVRGLFYNAPARRKFLKSPLRETELITKTVIQYALAYPQIAFRLMADGKESVGAPAASGTAQNVPLQERIAAVWGQDVAVEMLPVEYTSLDLHVRGVISRPSIARASRAWQNFFVNGRPIRSGLLAVMLERPYAGRLPENRHPLAVIHIEVDPQYLDVNVHPRKAEVRFHQERAIYGAVTQAVEKVAHDFPVIANAANVEWPFANVPDAAFPALRETPAEYRTGEWRAVAQIHNTYLLAQTPDGMVIVDQHAAQEQIFYERLTNDERPKTNEEEGITASGDSSFVLRPPSSVTLLPREAELIAAHLEEYTALGVDVEPFGTNTFRVNALPDFVTLTPRRVMGTLVQEHEKYRTLEGDALRDKLASKLACVSAIKAGDALTHEQQQELLDELLRIYSPATCPHGRPTFVNLTLEDLEKRFLRR